MPLQMPLMLLTEMILISRYYDCAILAGGFCLTICRRSTEERWRIPLYSTHRKR